MARPQGLDHSKLALPRSFAPGPVLGEGRAHSGGRGSSTRRIAHERRTSRVQLMRCELREKSLSQYPVVIRGEEPTWTQKPRLLFPRPRLMTRNRPSRLNEEP